MAWPTRYGPDPLDPQVDAPEYACPGEDCGEPISGEMTECPNCGRQLDAADFEPEDPADYY